MLHYSMTLQLYYITLCCVYIYIYIYIYIMYIYIYICIYCWLVFFYPPWAWTATISTHVRASCARPVFRSSRFDVFFQTLGPWRLARIIFPRSCTHKLSEKRPDISGQRDPCMLSHAGLSRRSGISRSEQLGLFKANRIFELNRCIYRIRITHRIRFGAGR